MYPNFAANSLQYKNYQKGLFKSAELGSYQLLQGAPGSHSGMQLPEDIRKIIGQSKRESPYAGAYPPMP